jgi:hypothetical protein
MTWRWPGGAYKESGEATRELEQTSDKAPCHKPGNGLGSYKEISDATRQPEQTLDKVFRQ